MASCIPYHGHIKINEYTMDQWVEYIIIVTRHVINKPRKNQARFVGQWKGLSMICENNNKTSSARSHMPNSRP
jgi:hypothetical protein